MSLSAPERRLILLSAGTAARRHAMRDQARTLTTAIDWPQLTQALLQRKLLPTLGPRVLELAEDRASEDFRTAVTHAVESARRHSAFLQLVSARVMSALMDAGINSTPLKGPMLGERIYGDPGRRLSSDIDLLVAPDRLRAAVDVVIGLGYAAPTDYVERGELPLLHFALPHEREELPPVELHWRVHWYERRFASERLLAQAGDSPADWRPAPADELVALLLFYARDGFVDLRLAADLAAWWDVYGSEVDSAAIAKLLSAYPALSRVIRVATKAAERTVGLPATQILGVTELGLRERIAVRLANPNPHTSASQLYADMGVVDGLLMPPGEFGSFVRRNVLLPREVLDDLDRRAPKRRARSSLGRGAGVLGRYGLTMTRLVKPPETLS
jgi:hypothetical protein